MQISCWLTKILYKWYKSLELIPLQFKVIMRKNNSLLSIVPETFQPNLVIENKFAKKIVGLFPNEFSNLIYSLIIYMYVYDFGIISVLFLLIT